MRTRLPAATTALIISLAGAVYADERRDARGQLEFGIAVAQKGLWHEAIFRWERAREIDPTYAAAYNNLAVAYEQEGLLDKAREAYEKALALEPKNELIRQNYEMFRETHDHQTRRDDR